MPQKDLKALHDITYAEWVTYEWIDVTEIGNEHRMMLRGLERLPADAVKASHEYLQWSVVRSNARYDKDNPERYNNAERHWTFGDH